METVIFPDRTLSIGKAPIWTAVTDEKTLKTLVTLEVTVKSCLQSLICLFKNLACGVFLVWRMWIYSSWQNYT